MCIMDAEFITWIIQFWGVSISKKNGPVVVVVPERRSSSTLVFWGNWNPVSQGKVAAIGSVRTDMVFWYSA